MLDSYLDVFIACDALTFAVLLVAVANDAPIDSPSLLLSNLPLALAHNCFQTQGSLNEMLFNPGAPDGSPETPLENGIYTYLGSMRTEQRNWSEHCPAGPLYQPFGGETDGEFCLAV